MNIEELKDRKVTLVGQEPVERAGVGKKAVKMEIIPFHVHKVQPLEGRFYRLWVGGSQSIIVVDNDEMREALSRFTDDLVTIPYLLRLAE